ATVIAVDNNLDSLFIIQSLLEDDLNIRAYRQATSAQELFKLLRQSPDLAVDLLLLDIQFPHDHGFEIIKQLRAEERFRNLKVVAVTSYVMPQEVEKARQAGFDGFIGKPLHQTRFPKQIRRLLAGEQVWEAQ
ncbi:MAG TPA: response regulator, partial [Herpetosiphonaceae bacterium]